MISNKYTKVPKTDINNIAIQKWALTSKGEHSVSIKELVTDVLFDCNVPYECYCDTKDCHTQDLTNAQLVNSINALLNVIQNLEDRIEALEGNSN